MLFRSETDGSYYRGTTQGSKLAGNSDLWNEGSLSRDENFEISGFKALPGAIWYNYWKSPEYNFTKELVNLADTNYNTDKNIKTSIGKYAYFWTATEHAITSAYYRNLFYDSTQVFRNFYPKNFALSVRCIKDSNE